MSTSTCEQVHCDYYYYVCTYIANQTSTTFTDVMQNIKNGTYTFRLSASYDSKDISIDSWNVADVTQPQSSDLMNVANTDVVDCKKSHKILTIASTYSDLMPLLFDIYNKIAVLQSTSQFADQPALLAYLKTLLP